MIERSISDKYFSKIPHWVIFSGISSGAIHLYAVLAKYADWDSGEAFPARSTLAKDIGKSPDTVDRHLKELKDIGAVTVETRHRKGTKENRSNRYTLIGSRTVAATPGAVVRPGGRMAAAENENHPTKPTSLTRSTSFTSEQSSEQSVSPSLSKRRKNDASKQNFKAENADPISPMFYHSNDRQILLQNIQSIAKAQVDHGIGSQPSEDMIDTLQVNLETAFGSDCIDELDGMIHDYAWIPKRTHVEKKRAAIWLNQLLNEWSDLSGGLQWRGEHVVHEE